MIFMPGIRSPRGIVPPALGLALIVGLLSGCATPADGRPGAALAADKVAEFNQRTVNAPGASGSRAPQLLKASNPIYPLEARRAGIQGVVLVEFIIDRAGNVAAAQAISSPNPLLSAAAVTCALQWKFEPGEVNGRKVSTRCQIPITFSL
jgi:TonB family protein